MISRIRSKTSGEIGQLITIEEPYVYVNFIFTRGDVEAIKVKIKDFLNLCDCDEDIKEELINRLKKYNERYGISNEEQEQIQLKEY